MNMTVSTLDRLNLLEQARLAVLFNGEPASPLLADWISHSWRRCLDQGLHPDYSVAFDAVSASHITRTLDAQRDFVQAAQPEIERLCRAIAGTSFFALLTDAQGVVLDVGGRVDRHDKRVDAIARVGVDLSEQSVGTTAISAALTGMGGVFFVMYVRVVDPAGLLSLFDIGVKIALIAMIGGIGTIYGPLLGALLIVPLDLWLRAFIGGKLPGGNLLVLGIILILASLFLKQGMHGAIKATWASLMRRKP